MPEIVREAKPKREWPAWCGEISDLRRVISLVTDLAQQRRSEVLGEIPEDDEWERKRWTDLERLVEVEIVNGVDSVSGSPDAVLEELDRRTIECVAIRTRFPGSTEELRLIFALKNGFKGNVYSNEGVELRIQSRNPGWAKQCLAQISDEVEKSVPKWAFFLGTRGKLLSLLFSLLVFLGVAALIEDRFIDKNVSTVIGITAVVLIMLSTPVAWLGSDVLWPWIFPRFELYSQAGSSSGSRRIGTSLVFAATLLGGIIVNLIT